MKVALITLALLLGSTAIAIPQTPQTSAGVDGKQYTIVPYVMSGSRQSYEEVCHLFYRSKVLGEGNELIGFRFVRDGETKSPVVRVTNLSVMIDETVALPTAQEVSEDGGGHYILRMNEKDRVAEKDCITGVGQIK